MSDLTEFFVRHYTLVLDNTEHSYREANKLARNVVIESGVTMNEYRAMSREDRESSFADDIGEQIAELIDSEAGDMAEIVSEIMMNHHSEVQWGLGAHYVPEDSDMEGYLDEEECEGHESLNGADMGQTVYCDGACR